MTTDDNPDPAQTIYPDLPNHAATEPAFLARVDECLADPKPTAR